MIILLYIALLVVLFDDSVLSYSWMIDLLALFGINPGSGKTKDWVSSTRGILPAAYVVSRILEKISIISLFHVSIISLKLQECHSYHSLISTLGRILVYDEYLTRASRSNTGTMCVGSKCRQH